MGARDCAASRPRGRRRRGRSAGQALVETALVLSFIFFPIFFLTIEFAMIMSSIGSFDFAAREAARVGSVVGRTDPNVDQYVINAITGRVQGLVAAQMTEVDIYRAYPNDGKCLVAQNAPPIPPTTVSVDDPTCPKDQYYFNGAGPIHTLCTGTGAYCAWPPDARNDALFGADYLGVRVLYKYTFVTPVPAAWGLGLNLSTYSVQRIEPQDYQGVQVSPPMASHVSGAGELALAATLPIWRQEDEGGIG